MRGAVASLPPSVGGWYAGRDTQSVSVSQVPGQQASRGDPRTSTAFPVVPAGVPSRDEASPTRVSQSKTHVRLKFFGGFFSVRPEGKPAKQVRQRLWRSLVKSSLAVGRRTNRPLGPVRILRTAVSTSFAVASGVTEGRAGVLRSASRLVGNAFRTTWFLAYGVRRTMTRQCRFPREDRTIGTSWNVLPEKHGGLRRLWTRQSPDRNRGLGVQ